mgnify:CR=1 FL=1
MDIKKYPFVLDKTDSASAPVDRDDIDLIKNEVYLLSATHKLNESDDVAKLINARKFKIPKEITIGDIVYYAQGVNHNRNVREREESNITNRVYTLNNDKPELVNVASDSYYKLMNAPFVVFEKTNNATYLRKLKFLIFRNQHACFIREINYVQKVNKHIIAGLRNVFNTDSLYFFKTHAENGDMLINEGIGYYIVNNAQNKPELKILTYNDVGQNK